MHPKHHRRRRRLHCSLVRGASSVLSPCACVRACVCSVSVCSVCVCSVCVCVRGFHARARVSCVSVRGLSERCDLWVVCCDVRGTRQTRQPHLPVHQTRLTRTLSLPTHRDSVHHRCTPRFACTITRASANACAFGAFNNQSINCLL